MDDNTLSQLMDRFYAIAQVSAQIQSIVEEINYIIDENASGSIKVIRELGSVLNQVLDQEGDKIIGLRDTAVMIDTMVVSIEHMKDKNGVQKILDAVERYKAGISSFKLEVDSMS